MGYGEPKRINLDVFYATERQVRLILYLVLLFQNISTILLYEMFNVK